MAAQILDGAKISGELREEIRTRVLELQEKLAYLGLLADDYSPRPLTIVA